jgi:hypothetical protein
MVIAKVFEMARATEVADSYLSVFSAFYAIRPEFAYLL